MTASAPEPSGAAATWQRVPQEAFVLAQGLVKLAQDVRQVISGCPLEYLDTVLYSPETKEAAILLCPDCPEGTGLDLAQAISPLVFYPWICKAGEVPGSPAETWVPAARGTRLPDQKKLAATYAALDDRLAGMLQTAFTKFASGDPVGYDPALRGLGEL